MSPKKSKLVSRLAVIGVVIASVLSLIFLVYVLDFVFGGSSTSPSVGAKSGSSLSGNQVNAGNPAGTSPPRTATPKPSPTPTPEGALPHIPGFNPDMQLEKIKIWWDGKQNDGKASGDAYLRAAYVKMCELLEEVEDYAPTGPELKLVNTYNGGLELEFTVYEGDIAEFTGYEGRYFKIPHISILADALLPIETGVLETDTRLRMEKSGMLGCYGIANSRVYLDLDISQKITGAFYDLSLQKSQKPEELPQRTIALVFYYHGIKHYIDVYETGLIRFNVKGIDVWYIVPLDEAERFIEIIGL